MRSKKEIMEKIEEFEMNENLSCPTASVFRNAPLALEQLALQSKIQALKWVLDAQ
jgi:hypothetical protein